MKMLLVFLAMVLIAACSTTGQDNDPFESTEQFRDKKFNRSQFRAE